MRRHFIWGILACGFVAGAMATGVSHGDISPGYCTQLCDSSYEKTITNGNCHSEWDPDIEETVCVGTCTATWSIVEGEGCWDSGEPSSVECVGGSMDIVTPTVTGTCQYTNGLCSCFVLEIRPKQAPGNFTSVPACNTVQCNGG